MAMTKSEAALYYAEKDAVFRRNTRTGTWPIDTCDRCAPRTEHGFRICCQRHHHHLHDNCTHCGNDERGL